MLALNQGRPQTFILKNFIEAFVKFREEVITRRTIYELGKAREKAHTYVGLAVAVANIDEVIRLIREAKNPEIAREQLMERDWPVHDVAPLIALIDDPEHEVSDKGTYKMSEAQARAILELRLHRLTGLERDKIGDELKEITDQVLEHLSVLASREKLLVILKNELIEVKTQFGTPRKTELVENFDEADVEDLIAREDMVVTVSNAGYAKRVPLSTYRAQKRGGKGRIGATTKEDDFVTDMFVASTHTPILFFTIRGIVHKMKVWQLPLANAQSRGKALVNLMPLEQGENVNVYLRLPENPDLVDQLDLMFATSHGTVRRNKLSDFSNIRANGLIAMKLEEGEKLVSVKICRHDEDIVLATRDGKAIRFTVDDIRVFAGRTSTGVRGIKLGGKDEVISMSVLKHIDATPEERAGYLKRANALRGAEEGAEPEVDGAAAAISEDKFKSMQASEQFLLCVTDKGYGKRTSAYDYRVTGRGGSGITNMNLTAKNGKMVATFPVAQDHHIMLVTNEGQMIRTPVKDIRFTGRATQGVRVFNVEEPAKVVSVAWLKHDEGENNDGDDTAEGTDAAIDAPSEGNA
jgi:DNA gyrase subunit A